MNITLIAIIIIYTLVVILATALYVKNAVSGNEEAWREKEAAWKSTFNLKQARILTLEQSKKQAEIDYKWAIEALERENKELREQLAEEAEEQESPAPPNPKERLPETEYTNMLRYMDYRKITDETSPQWELQQVCTTSGLMGIRQYKEDIYADDRFYGSNKWYCVALGSAYGCEIGDTWRVTLECGTTINIILAENKDDGSNGESFGDPDTNYDEYPCTNVIEFVVDEDKIPFAVKDKGTFSVLGYYGGLHGKGGNIVKMEYTGRAWKGTDNE